MRKIAVHKRHFFTTEVQKSTNKCTVLHFFTVQICKFSLFLNLITSKLVNYQHCFIIYCHLKQYVYLQIMKIPRDSLDMLYFWVIKTKLICLSLNYTFIILQWIRSPLLNTSTFFVLKKLTKSKCKSTLIGVSSS